MEWIKCSDQMPELDQEVIIPMEFQRNGDCILRQFVGGAVYKELIPGRKQFWEPSLNFTFREVEYWMPLPKLPRSDEP